MCLLIITGVPAAIDSKLNVCRNILCDVQVRAYKLYWITSPVGWVEARRVLAARRLRAVVRARAGVAGQVARRGRAGAVHGRAGGLRAHAAPDVGRVGEVVAGREGASPAGGVAVQAADAPLIMAKMAGGVEKVGGGAYLHSVRYWP